MSKIKLLLDLAADMRTVADDLESLGEGIGVVIKCQREEIFDSMHRI